MKKYLIVLFTVAALFSAIMFSASAANENLPLIIDEEDVLTDEQELKLESRLSELGEKYNMDFVVLINTSTGEKTPTAFADDYFDDNGYGRNDTRDGIILLLSSEKKDITTSTSGSAINSFSDSELEYIEQLLSPQIARGEYYSALNSFADECDKHISDYLESQKPKYFLYGVIGLCVGLLFAWIKGSKYKGELVSVVAKGNADDYITPAGLTLAVKEDVFAFSDVSKALISSSSSRSGGSSTHVSSSGRTHGGRSGHY